jgi:signal transduction histidine kinase
MTGRPEGFSVRPVDRIRRLRAALGRHPTLTDGAAAGVLLGFVLADIASSRSYLTGPLALYLPAAGLTTLPLTFRRRAPLPVALVVMGVLAAEATALGSSPVPDSQLVAWLLAIFSVAAYADRMQAAIGGAASIAAGVVWMGADDLLFPVVVFGGAWMTGRLVRQRQLYADALAARNAALGREHEANARAVASEERARIARELHDLLSHSVSVMVVQAAAERSALGSDRAAPGETLEAIERTGRQALDEMRRLFSLLRGAGPADLAPQPTLAQLHELVAQVRDAGLAVELRTAGPIDSVSTGVALCAYRVVQEALTNVLKHAGPAHASVFVSRTGDGLELEVLDDGHGDLGAPGNGHGLTGMRERVALYGGELQAGTVDQGGFAVRARIPLGSA